MRMTVAMKPSRERHRRPVVAAIGRAPCPAPGAGQDTEAVHVSSESRHRPARGSRDNHSAQFAMHVN